MAYQFLEIYISNNMGIYYTQFTQLGQLYRDLLKQIFDI